MMSSSPPMDHCVTHWGEMSDQPFFVTDAEWEMVTTNRSIELESSDRHQPSTVEHPQMLDIPPEAIAMDPIVVHTIELMQYAETLTNMIDSYPQGDGSPAEGSSPPPMPEGPVWKPRNEYTYPLHFMDRNLSEFAAGERKEPFMLTGDASKLVFKRSCAAILTITGFDSAAESAIDAVVGAAEQFMIKMVQLLRHAVDGQALFGPTGFPDAMDRVFHEMGLGSVLTLHDYYHRRILLRRQRALQGCHKLLKEYETVKLQPFPTPILPALTDASLDISQDLENGDEDEDVPEIHFPAPEDGDEAFSEHAQQTLEPGFQMLQSLEQEAAAAAEEAQANNAIVSDQDLDEIINVSDSPVSCQESILQTSDESPQSRQAKKRKKK